MTESKAPDPRPQPGLVFRPDERQVARMAALRRFLVIVALVIVGGAIVFLLVYRPRMRLVPDAEAAAPGRDSLYRPEPVPAPVIAPAPRPDVVREAAAVVMTHVEAVKSYWARSGAQLPGDLLERGTKDEVLVHLQEARLLVDSAGLTLAELRRISENIGVSERELESSRRYEASRLRAALDDVRATLDTQQRDWYLIVDNLELAARAMRDGEEAEAEIKTGVANSYRVRSENRGRQLERRLAALRDVIQRVLAAGTR